MALANIGAFLLSNKQLNTLQVLCLFFYCSSPARGHPSLTFSNTSPKVDVNSVLRSFNKVSGDAQSLASGQNSCLCSNYTCGCCYHLEVSKINLNDTACVNITYLVKDYGLEVEVTLDERVVFRKEISAKNPPPICGGIPYVHKLASVCLRLYNLTVYNRTFAACTSLEVEFEGVVLKDFELGCFHIPFINRQKKSDTNSELLLYSKLNTLYFLQENNIRTNSKQQKIY